MSKQPKISNAQLTNIINSSESWQEVCQRSGMAYGVIMGRAAAIRKSGTELKTFPRIQGIGLVGWLKSKWPDVYRDLRENYPEIYASISGK